MNSDSRAKMVRSAASLIGSHGLSATSFSDVLADSGAPRGSIYHHFPDGKKQLAQAAVTWVSDRVLAYQRGCTGATPAEVLRWFIAMWRQVVLASGGASGCVVAGVAIDILADDAELMDVVRSSFRSWTSVLAEQLEAAGIPAGRAQQIALVTLAAMEGALILCRAEGNVAPLDAVADELVASLLPASRTNAD